MAFHIRFATRERGLDQAVASLVAPALGGIGLIFAAFAFADLALYPADVRLSLFLVDGSCAVGLLVAGFFAWRKGVPRGFAHASLAAGALVIVGNSLLGAWRGVEPKESIYLVLLLLGTGSTFLSWRWNLAVVATTFAAWLAVALQEPLGWGTTQYMLGLFGACLASMLVCIMRARLHERAERLRERLDAVVGRAPIVLFTLDRDGVFTFIAGQGLAGLATPESLLGKSIFQFYPDTDVVARDVRRALAGETFTGVVESAGRSFVVRYGPLHAGDDGIHGVVGVATDVSERAQAHRELEESRKHLARQERLASLGTLVAGVAHEINNPLAFVRGNTQLLRDVLRLLEESAGLSEDEKRDVRDALGLVDTTLEGIDRLAHISESLRSVARGSSGQRQLEDLNVVARMALTVARPRLGKAVHVEEDLDAGRAVLVDRVEVGQVVLNLLLNAGDELAHRPDARIAIRAFDEGARVVIEVEDNGGGIPPDKVDLVFAPFYTTKTQGTGLGLSISHRIAHDHGGLLTVASAPGRTVFRLELPAADPPAPMASAKAST